MNSNIFQLETFARSGYMVRLAYVDIAEDLIAGILLGQIVYWYMPNEQGKNKLRVRKNGEFWLAKGREDWKTEIRITPKQYDRAIKILINKGFVEVQKFKFNGAPTNHIKLNISEVTQRVKSILTFGENPNYPLGEMEFNETVTSLTEITTENTTKKVSSSNIFAFYENNFGILNPFVADSITQWANDTSEELVQAAMERALKQQKKWNYAEGILKQWANKNIKTLDDVEALEAEYQRNKGAKNNAESGGSNTNRYSQKGEYDYGF
ncbi:DnaD domain-containing protein [Bacillus sp. COPE52]|uniref:DnaD domain-containing protein n=1 Tax=Bacillus sp. COPE52 TaxID=2233998 RepID=UPI0021C25AF7|nr:DnaD domain protein [Bacillus sp. COPE52]